MTRNTTVTLNDEARRELVDPMHDKDTGTVLSVCAQIATVQWRASRRTADYSTAWLCVVPDQPGKADLPEVKPRFDAKHAKGWKR